MKEPWKLVPENGHSYSFWEVEGHPQAEVHYIWHSKLRFGKRDRLTFSVPARIIDRNRNERFDHYDVIEQINRMSFWVYTLEHKWTVCRNIVYRDRLAVAQLTLVSSDFLTAAEFLKRDPEQRIWHDSHEWDDPNAPQSKETNLLAIRGCCHTYNRKCL